MRPLSRPLTPRSSPTPRHARCSTACRAIGRAPIDVSGHNKPELTTNLLDLLADIGITAADDPRVGRLLDGMLACSDPDGRFMTRASQRTGPPARGCLPCDTHAIADVLGRFGRAGDPRVRRALSAAEADLAPTEFGRAWLCRPDEVTGFRGPGRASEPCPQTTLEALRAFSWLPAAKRPAWLPEAVHSSLEIWRRRGERKPYMFGHGRQFKIAKWPSTWYSAYELVDVLGRLPETWRRGPKTRRRSPRSRRACSPTTSDRTARDASLHVSGDGRCSRSKKRPSRSPAALVWSRLAPLIDIAGEIASIDVLKLGSSKGGSGTPMPPVGRSGPDRSNERRFECGESRQDEHGCSSNNRRGPSSRIFERFSARFSNKALCPISLKKTFCVLDCLVWVTWCGTSGMMTLAILSI